MKKWKISGKEKNTYFKYRELQLSSFSLVNYRCDTLSSILETKTYIIHVLERDEKFS